MEARLGSVLYFLLVAVVFQYVQVQIASAVTCTAVSENPCKCTLAGGGEIDLSPLFGEQLSVQGTGVDAPYTFTYDACKTVPCGGNPDKCSGEGGCLACQNGGGVNIWGIASVTSVKWGEVTTPGYTFTINYKNSAQNKNSQVSYTLDSGSGSPQFTFAGEEPSDTYNFAVSGCFNTPTNNCGAPSPSGGGINFNPLFAVGLLLSVCFFVGLLVLGTVLIVCFLVHTRRTHTQTQSVTSRTRLLDQQNTSYQTVVPFQRAPDQPAPVQPAPVQPAPPTLTPPDQVSVNKQEDDQGR